MKFRIKFTTTHFLPQGIPYIKMNITHNNFLEYADWVQIAQRMNTKTVIVYLNSMNF